MRPWRLLMHPEPARGAWQMALDEAILDGCSVPGAVPTLRLYAWQPACLSLGIAQPGSDVDLDALRLRGWDVVRRPTGGRAVLHTDELTYAVIGCAEDPALRGSVLDSYRTLAEPLIAALSHLGLQAAMQPIPEEKAGREQNPVCFEVPSTYEITAGGKKLFGSAQARRREAVLQHGSLPLTGDLRRILQVLVFPDEARRQNAAERLLAHAATLETLLGKAVSWEQAAEALICSFQECLGLELVPGEISPGELRRAEELAIEKYARL